MIFLDTKVPILKSDTSELLMKLMDDAVGIQDVVDAVERLSIIVAKLISLANSAWSNPTTEVTTAATACTRLGLDIVRTTAIGLAVGRSFNILDCPEFNRRDYWARSIVTSDVAASLAPQFEVDAGSARTAGLLNSVGLLWLADGLPEETSRALTIANGDAEISLNEQLEQTCGIGYREAGRRLLTAWRLPKLLIAGVSVPEDSDEDVLRRMHALIEISIRIASMVCAGGETAECDDRAELDPSFVPILEAQLAKYSETIDMADALFST